MRRFRDVQVNQEFRFLSEVKPMFAGGGLAHGPWVKLSARTYRHVDDDPKDKNKRLQVGSINVEVAN